MLVVPDNILAGLGIMNTFLIQFFNNEYIFNSIFQTLDFAQICKHLFHILEKNKLLDGACSSLVVKAVCYKLEGCGFNTRRGEFLNLSNPSGRSRPWGSLSL
jgi:hypothetical protein